MLAADVRPYVVGFLYLILPTAILLLGVNLINTYGWLRNTPQLYLVLRLAGALMIVTAGVWAAFQQDVGRLMGYVVIIETGFSLLALSLNTHLGTEIFTMMFLPRVIALGLWSLSVSVILNDGHTLQYQSLERIAEKLPFASAGLAAALLTMAGLPLLAAFPIRQVLLQEIAVQSPLTALWVLGGSMGLLFSGFRRAGGDHRRIFRPAPTGRNPDADVPDQQRGDRPAAGWPAPADIPAHTDQPAVGIHPPALRAAASAWGMNALSLICA